MIAAMHAVPRPHRAPRLALLLALAALGPATGASAATQPAAPPKFPIPASERVHAATTGAPATSITTTPASVKAASGTSPGLPADARRTTARPTKLSAAAIVAAALAVLLIVVCLAWGAARWFAYEPRWSVSLRHSLAEASWRLSASWDEFSDWARIGR
jgi:hypothetical protein